MASQGVPAVDEFSKLLEEMLERAAVVKKSTTVDPPLAKSGLLDLFERIPSIYSPAPSPNLSTRHSFEAALRDKFNTLLATTSIDTPSFVKIWNLLDIISILSDEGQTENSLLVWLLEELLESQTIDGCRKIFDYLESRRERITAKDFDNKKLVILRSCNELLRRLSRAQDTGFCGRVFIFLFLSFPLGDKSSVNLRGEFHVENVTTFDVLPPDEVVPEKMEVDTEPAAKTTPSTGKEVQSNGRKGADETSTKGVSFSKAVEPLPASQLYPIFWALQQSFSQPKRLFDDANFTIFKAGVEATMLMFLSVKDIRPTRVAEDSKQQGIKRKRSEGNDDLANAFNPKYLTSRDLFELEIHDISFRRNILVQVLIVLDFLLSLSTKAKEDLAKSGLPENVNKSVMYADQTFNEKEATWATDMKKTVSDYLKALPDGNFFFRMVETVLTRDTNWSRWKIENCPAISRPPVTAQEYSDAIRATKNKFTTKKHQHTHLSRGLFDLSFLAEGNAHSKLDRLKDKSRFQLPAVADFKNKIAEDDMDIDMCQGDEETKNKLIEAKYSKTWRALRVATASKLVAFDRIEKSDKIDKIFEEVEPEINGDADMSDLTFPKDRRPIVISGPSGVGKGTLITMLLEKHSKVIGKKASHTTRKPREEEVHGQHYYFITKEEYDMMRDGDQFLEYNNFNGNDYGTSRKVLEGIIAQNKVPIMEMDYHGIQQLKDQEYAARFIFLAPPDVQELEQRLKKRGTDDDEKIQGRLKIAQEELEHAKLEGFHDVTFVNDDLETTFKTLEAYIFGTEGEDVGQSEDLGAVTAGNGVNGELEATNKDVEMANGETSASVPEEPASKDETPAPIPPVAAAVEA